MQLALDKATNDLYLEDGKLKRVDKGRFVVQQVESKLKTLLGEWVLDRTVGYIDLEEDLIHNPDLFDLEFRLQEIVTKTKGVLSLDFIDLKIVDRQLTIDFKAKTIYGEIDTTVPWTEAVMQQGELPLPTQQEVLTHNGQIVTQNGIAITFTPT